MAQVQLQIGKVYVMHYQSKNGYLHWHTARFKGYKAFEEGDTLFFETPKGVITVTGKDIEEDRLTITEYYGKEIGKK